MKRKQRPVFFDATGKRWKKAKFAFAVIASTLSIAIIVLVPPMIASVSLPVLQGVAASGSPGGGLSLQAAIDAMNAHNAPVIGKGPLFRAVRIESKQAYDIFTGADIRALTDDELTGTDGSQYAIDRYGAVTDKKLALTFDDGPDPAYTGQLLDLLSKNGVPASFFVIGQNIVKYPELASRAVREGHTLGNHTFTHIDMDFTPQFLAEQQVNQAERVLRAATGHGTAFARIPYAGSTDQAMRDSIAGELLAQRMGYIVTGYDYDTRDWTFKTAPAPDPGIFNGQGKVILLHDSGGDRQPTLAYVGQLIAQAKKAGYSFASLNQLYAQTPALFEPVKPTLADTSALLIGDAVLVWPSKAILVLFGVTVGLLALSATANTTLATLYRRRSRRMPHLPRGYRPFVSIIIPAHNEQDVLAESVRSLFRSEYRKIEVIIVNDGSTDDTAHIARKLEATYKRLRVLHQRNRGKAAALNFGLHKSRGEVIVCLDADTVLTPLTIRRLVRHFRDPTIGAVAGHVKVGNIRNVLSTWQALEYATSIAIERSAQAFLGAIIVVPGACGAWRKEALLKAKGFSSRTLAEDCDTALAVHQAGYQIAQDSTALGLTECPLTFPDLAKQRFRWTFGNIQSYWKHHNMFFNRKYGWLGMVVLPNAALSILLPLVFWPLLLGLTVENLAAGRYEVIAIFFVAGLALQTLIAFIGLRLAGERISYLRVLPMTRLMYGPLRTYLLFRSAMTVLQGVYVGWNKFARTGTVNAQQSSAQHSLTFRPARPGAKK